MYQLYTSDISDVYLLCKYKVLKLNLQQLHTNQAWKYTCNQPWYFCLRQADIGNLLSRNLSRDDKLQVQSETLSQGNTVKNSRGKFLNLNLE